MDDNEQNSRDEEIIRRLGRKIVTKVDHQKDNWNFTNR